MPSKAFHVHLIQSLPPGFNRSPDKAFIFTFVPAVKKLQNKITMTEEERSGLLTGKSYKVERRSTHSGD